MQHCYRMRHLLTSPYNLATIIHKSNVPILITIPPYEGGAYVAASIKLDHLKRREAHDNLFDRPNRRERREGLFDHLKRREARCAIVDYPKRRKAREQNFVYVKRREKARHKKYATI